MSKRKKIENLTFSAIKEINEQLPREQQLGESRKTILFGKDGSLDSLGLVNFLVIIEQNIEDEFSVNIVIADEKAMSQKHSPFRTIDTLVDYIEILLKED